MHTYTSEVHDLAWLDGCCTWEDASRATPRVEFVVMNAKAPPSESSSRAGISLCLSCGLRLTTVALDTGTRLLQGFRILAAPQRSGLAALLGVPQSEHSDEF